MRFNPKSLGATMIDLPQTQLFHVCDFSVGEERIYCHTCNSIGHKNCFKKLSPMREGSDLRYFCFHSHCQHDFLRNETRLIAQRAQKRQVDKMLSDTVKKLPAIKFGDNVRVPIPIEDRVKLGQKHLLGVVTSIFGSSYTVGTFRGTLDRKYRRGEIEIWKSSSYLSIDEIPKTAIKLRIAAKFISNNRIIHYCQCGGRCVTKHCPCRIDEFHCTSGCHPKVIGKCRNSQIASKNTTHSPQSRN